MKLNLNGPAKETALNLDELCSGLAGGTGVQPIAA
jgi:hypothetical protein